MGNLIGGLPPGCDPSSPGGPLGGGPCGGGGGPPGPCRDGPISGWP